MDGAFLKNLWKERFNGKIKLWLTNQLFLLRKQHTLSFTDGDYQPLTVKGKYRENVIAFACKHRQTVFIVAAPLHLAALCDQQNKSWKELDWADTSIILPDDILPAGESVLQNNKIFFKKD